jgi:formylglycine-generating enzyme required for sulfatase activity
MKRKHCLFLMAFGLLTGIRLTVAQQPVTTSFSQNGVLVCSNLASGSTATIQWASSPTGSWSNLFSVTVTSNQIIEAGVPMFYRVLQAVPTNLFSSMVPIQAGFFTIGDTLDDNQFGDAAPTNIYVSTFYVDTTVVTYSQWQVVYAYAINRGYQFDYAGSGKATNHPVQTVDWYDCVKWCNARSQQAFLTPVYYTDAGLTQVYKTGQVTNPYVQWNANGYRLPTEAEWEKAARGGLSGRRFPWGDTISETQANYYASPGSYDLGPYSGFNTNFTGGGWPYTSPVGYFAPNSYGLYDMAGNVWEWCWDWYGTPYGQPTTNNPTGPAVGTYRAIRGGSLMYGAYYARCADRSDLYPSNPGHSGDTGFRTVRGH